jgi:rSAM/selenodomain-associated transferase 2
MVVKISIVIPIYNEIDIDRFLANLINSTTYKNYEVIVADSSQTSTIKTKNIIKVSSKKGRAKQMNSGAKYADGEIVLFLHADTLLPKDGLESIAKTFKKRDIVAGAFDLSFDSRNIFLKIISIVASYRSRFTKIPYGDQAIFIQKNIFEKIGGYENISLMEDVNLMQKLKSKNYKIEILKSRIITSARRYEKDGIIFTTFRNLILVSLYYLGFDANRLARFYKS